MKPPNVDEFILEVQDFLWRIPQLSYTLEIKKLDLRKKCIEYLKEKYKKEGEEKQ